MQNRATGIKTNLKVRGIGLKLLALVGSIAFVPFMLELLVRMFIPVPALQLKGMYHEDPELGYFWLRPGYEGVMKTSEYRMSVRINSLGFRDYEKPIDEHAFKILAIGDSFTFGWGVDLEESYPAVLERMLNESSHTRFQVIKVGGPAQGTSQQHKFLQVKGVDYKPNLVLVGFFVGNDFRDTAVGIQPMRVVDGALDWKPEILEKWRTYDVVSGKRFGSVGSGVKREDYGRSLATIEGFLRTHSHAYQRLVQLKGRLFGSFSNATNTSLPRHTIFDYDSWLLESYPSEMQQTVDETLDYLLRMRELSRTRGAKFAVVLIPFRAQVDLNEWEAVRRTWESRLDRDKPQKIIQAWAREHNVATLDLLPKFREYTRSSGKPLYHSRDVHWNNDGHRLAAQLICNWLHDSVLRTP